MEISMKKVIGWIGKLLSILSLIFIVYAVWKLGIDFSQIKNWPGFILILVIGILGKGITVFISGSVWIGWLSFFARKKAKRKEAYRIYTKANIGKYLPGNIMQYVGRNLYAGKLGIDQKRIAVSSLIEIISLAFVAFVTALLFAGKQVYQAIAAVIHIFSAKEIFIVFLLLLIGAACLVALITFYRKRVSAILKEYKWSQFIVRLLCSMFCQAIVLTILGLIFLLLYLYMGGEMNITGAMTIIAGYIISWVLGFIVPGAPGGIGIREMVLTLLVGPVVGQELVVTIALIHRLITIIGDFLAYVVGAICCRSEVTGS